MLNICAFHKSTLILNNFHMLNNTNPYIYLSQITIFFNSKTSGKFLLFLINKFPDSRIVGLFFVLCFFDKWRWAKPRKFRNTSYS